MSNEKKIEKKRITDIGISLIPVLMLVLIVGVFFDVYYDLNDDVAIRNILSGAFGGTPSAMTVYVYVLPALLISFLYRLFPVVPWFGLCEILSLMFCIFSITYVLVKRMEKMTLKLLCAAVVEAIFASLLLYQFVFVQYTIVAGVLAGAGAFILFMLDDKAKPKDFILASLPAIFLEIIAFNLRSQIMLLELPLIGVLYIAKWILGAKETDSKLFARKTIIKYFTPLVAVVILMGASFVANNAAYSTGGWKEYTELNKYRTVLLDYQCYLPDYEEHKEFYENAGIDATELALLGTDNYNIALDKKLDSNAFKMISDYNHDVLGISGRNSVRGTLSTYKSMIFKASEYKYAYVIIGVYVILFALSLMSHSYEMIVFEVILAAARSLSWVYMIYKGRIRDRITIPLGFTEVLIVTAMIVVTLSKMKKKKEMWSVIALVLVAVTALTCLPGSASGTFEEYERRERINRNWNELLAYCEKEDNYHNYYFLDTMSTVDYSEKIFAGREDGYNNYEIIGGWVVDNPLFDKKLSQRGIGELPDDLALENTYFVAKSLKDTKWLTDYLNKGQNGDEAYFLEQVDIVGNIINEKDVTFTIYKINKQ